VVIGYHFLTVVTAPTVAEMAEISQKAQIAPSPCVLWAGRRHSSAAMVPNPRLFYKRGI
jgi:hypothetical protein